MIPENVNDIRILLYVAILTAYAVKMFYYIPAYRNMEKYIDYNLHEQPDQFAAWNWKGVIERGKGRIFSAMHYWSIGLRYKETSFRINYNLAMAFKDLGQLKRAEKFLEAARKGIPPEILARHIEQLNREEADIQRRMGMQRIAKPTAQDMEWLRKRKGLDKKRR